MLSIYLFSIGGQLAMHQYFSYVADKFFSEQTSKGLYNINDLTEVEIPVNMPNISDWKEYENRDYAFIVNFPVDPEITDATYPGPDGRAFASMKSELNRLHRWLIWRTWTAAGSDIMA